MTTTSIKKKYTLLDSSRERDLYYTAPHAAGLIWPWAGRYQSPAVGRSEDFDQKFMFLVAMGFVVSQHVGYICTQTLNINKQTDLYADLWPLQRLIILVKGKE